MATTAKAPKEKIYECEVKRRRVAAGGGYEPFWKVKSIADALEDNDTEFRCKDCRGPLKLHKKKAIAGSTSHVEHLHRADSEYCPAGMYFQQATDGRTSRWSEKPVE